MRCQLRCENWRIELLAYQTPRVENSIRSMSYAYGPDSFYLILAPEGIAWI